MKNLTAGLCFLTIFLIFGCSKKTIPQSPDISDVPVISTPLGYAFHGTRCDGSVGLCSVSKGTGNNNSGMIAERIDGKTIDLLINRKVISEEQELKITGTKIPVSSGKINYYIEEEIEIDEDVVKALALTKDYKIIPKGYYPLNHNNNFITIRIKLTRK